MACPCVVLQYLFLAVALTSPLFSAAACPAQGCQLLSPCSRDVNCAQGLYCGNCPASGKNHPSCTRGQATRPTDIRVTFYNQEDTVTNQLRNGVRGLMLDMYDFEGDIWLCHSFQGQCYNFTAFEPAINTLKEVGSFLDDNPTEIVTIFIEDYVRVPNGLSRLFGSADLMKYWYPLKEMPINGNDWPTVANMVEKNYRLLVFTSVASKEADEGIAYQWRYLLENEPGDPGIVPGSCPNRKESQPLSSRYASLFLQNYFPTIPVQNDACKEHSSGLSEMVDSCYKAAGRQIPNFLAVNFYMRSDGGGVFDMQDRMNGLTLCGCPTIFLCKPGAPFGACKILNSSAPPTPIANEGGIFSGYVEFSGSSLRSTSSFCLEERFLTAGLLVLSFFILCRHF
ncbi:hypothetical protein HPP92_021545 [Vanilla planifolia]|uniref:PI-PLC X domain-containing protein n=1 Tax=Vanilla planifolia TaxID=51239 RepID=A0A835Q015_VANPL|nr:hypothetical protein HPP92_021545 [Vanilla planifolia]